MNKKIISLCIFVSILILIPVNSVTGKNIFKNTSENNPENFNNYWAVIVTVGEPKRDDKNAVELYNLLINHGWDENNILYIKEENATKDDILSIPDWLNIQGAEQDDLILFYFSMHGGKTDDVFPYDEPDDIDEFVIPYKQDEKEGNILDEELADMFDNIFSENLIIIFETCYSGGMIDGADDLRKSGRIIITSAKEDETSYAYYFREGWLFPYYLNRGLQGRADKNRDGFVTAEEAYRYTRFPVILRSTIYGYLLYIFHKSLFNQHPQIYDGWPSEENNEEELILTCFN